MRYYWGMDSSLGKGSSTALLETSSPTVDNHNPYQNCRFALSNGVELFGLCWPRPDSDLRPVVLIHGLASNAYMWVGVANELHRRGHHVVALNLRGHYHSSKPTTGYDLATVANDVIEVIDTAQVEQPIIVGQSWGANVALELAATQPSLISGLVCVDGGYIDLSAEFESWQQCKEKLTPPTFDSMSFQDLEQYFETLFAKWPDQTRTAPLKSYQRLDNGKVAPWLPLELHLQILKSLWLHKPTETAPRVRTPTILISAHDDGYAPESDIKSTSVRALLEALPHARAYSFFPAHHDIHAQYPVLVANLIASLPQGITRSATLTRVAL